MNSHFNHTLHFKRSNRPTEDIPKLQRDSHCQCSRANYDEFIRTELNAVRVLHLENLHKHGQAMIANKERASARLVRGEATRITFLLHTSV